MATLRDNIGINTSTGLAEQLQDQSIANGMGSLRKGFEAGRIGNELNPLYTQALDAQLANDKVKETSLRERIGQLEQRQGMYAPEVGRVEDVNSVGSGLSWLGSQVGQGVASTLDPLAASTGLTAAGRVLTAIPNPVAKGLGYLAQGAGFAVPYAMSREQLTGEFLGEAGRDKTLMANTSPQALRDQANTYGSLAAIPDSAFPALIGRQLTGGVTRGVGKTGIGTKFLANNTLEGVTEAGQDFGSQYARGELNPLRDTSGDTSSLINSFAGGFAGASPMSALGAAADTGFARAGDTAERLGTKAGETIDLLRSKAGEIGDSAPVTKAKETAKKWWQFGENTVTDLKAAVQDEDGNITPASVGDAARDGFQTLKTPFDERVILMGNPPDALGDDVAKQAAWMTANDPKRAQLVANKLSSMPDDADAQAYLAAIQNPDAAAQQTAIDDAARFVLDRSELEQLDSRAQAASKVIGQAVGTAGKALGGAAMAVAKGALKFGRATLDGAMEGARKKNMQFDGELSSYDQWRARREEAGLVPNRISERVQEDLAASKMGPDKPANIAAQQQAQKDAEINTRRATLYGEMMASASKGTTKGIVVATRAGSPEAREAFMRDMGYEIADMAESWGLNSDAPSGQPTLNAATRQVPGTILALNSIANSMRVVYGDKTEGLIGDMQSMADPKSAPLFDQLREAVVIGRTEQGKKSMADMRSNAANQLLMLLPSEQAAMVLRSGPDGKEELLQGMESLARGHVSPKQRKEFNDTVGGYETLNRMLEVVGAFAKPELSPGDVVDDRNATGIRPNDEPNLDDAEVGSEDLSSFDKNTNERVVRKGSGPVVYGFHATRNLRSNDERSDPFAATTESDGTVSRPALFTKGQTLSPKTIADLTPDMTMKDRAEWAKDPENSGAIENKIKQVKKLLLEDPENYDDYDNHQVRAATAYEVMGASDKQPGRMLKLYSDYMRMAYNKAEEGAPERNYYAQQARLASQTTLDSLQRMDADGKMQRYESKTTPGERRQILADAEKFFKERYVVVGEQLSNRDSEKMSLTEALALHDEGTKAISFARKDGLDPVKLSAANILMFPSSKVRSGELAIPAGKLVKLVRKQRGLTEEADAEDTSGDFSNKDKNRAYLDDVGTGIAMLTGSGLVTGMPYKMNPDGRREDFGKSVPASLGLVTSTYGEMQRGKRSRLETNAARRAKLDGPPEPAGQKARREAEAYDEKVAREQALGEQDRTVSEDEPFDEFQSKTRFAVDAETPMRVAKVGLDSLRKIVQQSPEKAGLLKEYIGELTNGMDEGRKKKFLGELESVNVSRSRSEVFGELRNALPRAAKVALNSMATQGERDKYIVSLTEGMDEQEKGEFLADLDLTGPNGAVFYPASDNAKTSKTDRAPLDFFKKQEDGAVLDEFASQRLLSVLTAADPSKDSSIGPEPKMTAVSSAKFRADKIVAAYKEDPAAGTDMLRQRVRMAMSPEFVKESEVKGLPGKKQVVGGVHYIAPVAAFINAAELVANGVDMPANTIAGIRQQVANVLLKGKVSDERRLQIAKLMLNGETNVNGLNVMRELQKLADVKVTKAPQATGSAAPEVANAGLPKDQLTLSGTNERKLNAQSGDANNDARAKLITRLADDRRDEFLHASKTDVISRKLGTDTFGPLGREFTHFFATDGSSTHAFIVPNQFLARLDAELSRRPEAESQLKAIAFFAVQHAMYDKVGGEFATFGPRVKTPAADLLESMGALGDTGQKLFSGGYVTRVEGVSGRETVRFLANALAYAKHVAGKDQIPVSWERTTGGNIGKVGGGIFDARDGTGNVASQAQMDEAVAYANKVLGPKIKVMFKEITGYSGEFIDAKNVIEISTTAAAGTMNTLYHEAMHVFFRDFVKGNPKMQAVFESLINDPKHMQKLYALLDGYPAAQAQLTSGEERLAYTYQFWKAGLLQVDAKASTWLQKLGKFFRQVLGTVRDSERALELFQAFDNGKMSEPSAAGQVIADALGRGANALKTRRKLDGLIQGLAALALPAGEILAKSESPTARLLGKIMFTNPGDETHGTSGEGLLNARRTVAQRYINTVNSKFESMSQVDQTRAQDYLQKESALVDIADPDHREAVKHVRSVLERFHKYMTDAGMNIGKVENYYPTVWSIDALNNKRNEFVNMLVTKYAQEMAPLDSNPKKAAERIWQSLVESEGVDARLQTQREDGVLNPFFASQEQRTLPWLRGEDKERFLEKNMPLTLTRYFNQGAHATEYFRRFGEGGERLDAMLNGKPILDDKGQEIGREKNGVIHELRLAARQMRRRGELETTEQQRKWVERQMRDINKSVGAMEGALGKDVSPNMRKFNSWMAVYQNIRVLPLALFSSFVDPLALVARGAPMQAAYETFIYNMREVWHNWSDAFKDMPPNRQKDEWRQLAEQIGAAEIAMFQHHVADEYASAYMTSGAKKINDKMFVLNGMEAWNRGSRIMATKWATKFLERHAALPDKDHSARWLKELGLTAGMVPLDSDGRLVTDRHALKDLKGISLDEATKQIAPIHAALNRWVEGAVLTPNAAQRPAWSSDPHYATLFHLKQFSYSFHQTILKRAANEFKHGNIAPVGALAMFIPTMITADVMKGLIQGGGTLPPYMASMNAGDWFMHGAQRAGLAGIGEVGIDAGSDWASLGGPAFEQVVDAARDGFGSKTLLKAAPLNALYANLV